MFWADLTKFAMPVSNQVLKGQTIDPVCIYIYKLFLILGMESKMFKNVHILTFLDHFYNSTLWAIMVPRKHLLSVINFRIIFLGKETTNQKFCLKILRFVYEILRILTNNGLVCIFEVKLVDFAFILVLLTVISNEE